MKLRHFAFFLILVLLGLLALRYAGQLPQFIDLIRQMNPWWLLAVLPVRFVYYWSSTKYYDRFYGGVYQKHVPFWKLFEGVVAMNFVNTVIPTGGISGAAFFAQIFQKQITQRESYLAQFFWYIATFLSVAMTLGLSFLLLFFSQEIALVSFRLILIVTSFLLFIALAIIAITINPRLFERALFVLTRPMNWILKLFKRGTLGAVQTRRFVDSYRRLVDLLLASPRHFLRMIGFAWLCIICEMASITLVFLALDQVINPGVAGVMYVFALILSVASVFTSGVGVYEATMIATAVALGIPFQVAFSVTTIYRLIALWLFIPVGLIFYKRQAVDEPQGHH